MWFQHYSFRYAYLPLAHHCVPYVFLNFALALWSCLFWKGFFETTKSWKLDNGLRRETDEGNLRLLARCLDSFSMCQVSRIVCRRCFRNHQFLLLDQMQQENGVCSRGVLCFYAVYQFTYARVCVVGSGRACVGGAACVGVPVGGRGARRTERRARSVGGASRQSCSERREAAASCRVEPRLAIPTLCTGNFSKQFRADSIVARHCRFEFRTASWSTPFDRLYVHCRAFIRLSVYFWIFSKRFTAKFSKRSSPEPG